MNCLLSSYTTAVSLWPRKIGISELNRNIVQLLSVYVMVGACLNLILLVLLQRDIQRHKDKLSKLANLKDKAVWTHYEED